MGPSGETKSNVQNSNSSEIRQSDLSLFDISTTDLSFSAPESEPFFSMGEEPQFQPRQVEEVEEPEFDSDFEYELEVARGDSDPESNAAKERAKTEEKILSTAKDNSLLTGLELSWKENFRRHGSDEKLNESLPDLPDIIPRKSDKPVAKSPAVLTALENSICQIFPENGRRIRSASSISDGPTKGVSTAVEFSEKRDKSKSERSKDSTETKSKDSQPLSTISPAKINPPKLPVALVMVDESTAEEGIYGFGENLSKFEKKEKKRAPGDKKKKKRRTKADAESVPCFSSSTAYDPADDATVVSSSASNIAETPKNAHETTVSPKKVSNLEVLTNEARRIVCCHISSELVEKPKTGLFKWEDFPLVSELTNQMDFVTALNVLRPGLHEEDYCKLMEKYQEECRFQAIKSVRTAQNKDDTDKGEGLNGQALGESINRVFNEARQKSERAAERRERQNLDNVHRNVCQLLKDSQQNVLNEFSGGEKLKSKTVRCEEVRNFEDLKKDLQEHTENEMRKIVRRVLRRERKAEETANPSTVLTTFSEPRNRMGGPAQDTVSKSMEITPSSRRHKKGSKNMQKKEKSGRNGRTKSRSIKKSRDNDIKVIREANKNSSERTLQGIESLESIRSSAVSENESFIGNLENRNFQPRKTVQKSYQMKGPLDVNSVINYAKCTMEYWQRKEGLVMNGNERVDVELSVRKFEPSKTGFRPKRGDAVHSVSVDQTKKRERVRWGVERPY
ncbi:unnamed protein product [Bursaphelenchus xylophilus]|uniref:(pine wood nematode) hypothetical protein n=1 Tax=Bursaphelenchus xylophilus TaxID=6326 RepID=A0A1I7RVW7_BURXY|nr:unnamed protein product [Bursaphelenchus xylophilus]CAG9094799.1 unnamed protein product [Bursaphelenchus xylophilus]